MGSADDAPEDGVAFKIASAMLASALEREVGVGFQGRQIADRRRRLVGLEAAVGVEHLAVGGIDQVVAVDARRCVWSMRLFQLASMAPSPGHPGSGRRPARGGCRRRPHR